MKNWVIRAEKSIRYTFDYKTCYSTENFTLILKEDQLPAGIEFMKTNSFRILTIEPYTFQREDR